MKETKKSTKETEVHFSYIARDAVKRRNTFIFEQHISIES